MDTKKLIESEKSSDEIVDSLSSKNEGYDRMIAGMLNYSPEDLVSIADSKFGWSVAEQLENLLSGDGFSAQNVSALKYLKTFAEDKGEYWLADAINFYLERGTIEYLTDYEM